MLWRVKIMRMPTNKELQELCAASEKEKKRAFLLTSGRITYTVQDMDIYQRAINILAYADGQKVMIY